MTAGIIKESLDISDACTGIDTIRAVYHFLLKKQRFTASWLSETENVL